MTAPFDWKRPYPSGRSPLLARNVVATSQPLAAQAGLAMLRWGGNAVDAALAAATALTVVEPCSNGVGSDAFAIVWDGERLHGLNASGRSPAAWSRERFSGLEKMPGRDWDSVTVPGAVSAWAALSERFGKLSFAKLFEPAVGYAREGFLVSPTVAGHWAAQGEDLGKRFPDFADAWLRDSRAPRAGQRFVNPALAETLEAIAETGGSAFYRGELAKRMIAASDAGGGVMTREDLYAHRADWVEPLSVPYRGLRLHEVPPNGQGIAALIALGILERFDLAQYPPDSADSLHVQMEAMKLAFTDVYRHVADPDFMAAPAAELLDPERLAEEARSIDMQAAHDAPWGLRSLGDTVYLTAADESGMMVSYIQSNANGFGSGVVVPGTSISLQNRGVGFSLDEEHPNCVAGGKRPFHTIIPGFVTRDGEPLMSFGVMGGPMQPQGHVQMMVRLADYGQNPQTASDAPRWRAEGGRQISVESGLSGKALKELARRGHAIETVSNPGRFGGAQLIYKLPGGYCAGSDHRKDGCAAGF